MTRPPEIVRWEEIERPEWSYQGRSETMGRDADYGRHFGFARLGLHHVRLAPGHRTSLPHAESAEDEFILVLEGTPDVWLDGVLHRLAPGDAVGFKAGTGLAHTFLNNSDADGAASGRRRYAAGREQDPLSARPRPEAAAQRLVGGCARARAWAA
jgi:uncharacterized cupin superfamily protein